MHPLLSPHLHPQCKEIILEFNRCHEENVFGKFFGACNKARINLDRCLDEEVCFRNKTRNVINL